MRKNENTEADSLVGTRNGNTWTIAILSALLFFLAGIMTGIVGDRLWLHQQMATPPPLTVDAMVSELALTETDERRVREFLDQMHPALLEAVEAGPDALLAATQSIHQRLLEMLPPEARPRFRRWLEQHHHGMMQHLGSSGDDFASDAAPD